MCQSSEAEACRGSDASQAEFRSAKHTPARLVGLLLIVAGVLGMLLLLGFIALRLLAAALFSLLYLLLAPAAVLAPALGEGGRAAFRRWLTKLLGAVVSKLVYSFLLGVVLTVVGILSELRALGWWTQWLLTSAFWWGAYARRHQAFGSSRTRVAPVSVYRRRARSRAAWATRSRHRVPRCAGCPGPNVSASANRPATSAPRATRGRTGSAGVSWRSAGSMGWSSMSTSRSAPTSGWTPLPGPTCRTRPTAVSDSRLCEPSSRESEMLANARSRRATDVAPSASRCARVASRARSTSASES